MAWIVARLLGDEPLATRAAATFHDAVHRRVARIRGHLYRGFPSIDVETALYETPPR